MNKSFFQGKKIYICSPLSGADKQTMQKNQRLAEQYANEYNRHYGCQAIAPQAYLPFFLNDNDPRQRELATTFGIQLLDLCDAIVVFGDFISAGMREELLHAYRNNIPIISRPESHDAVVRFLHEQQKLKEGTT